MLSHILFSSYTGNFKPAQVCSKPGAVSSKPVKSLDFA